MQSSRLPGKVLKNLGDKVVLKHVFDRVKLSRVKNIAIVTSKDKSNDLIEIFCQDNNILCFRGDEDNVLSRFYNAAVHFNADPIVRITADCPFIDPEVINKVVNLYFDDTNDYCSNIHPPTYPDGLDVEIFSFESLKKAFSSAKLKTEIEHVTPYIWKHTGLFKCVNLTHSEDLSKYRIVLDNDEDLQVLEKIYNIKNNNNFIEILNIINKDESLKLIDTRNSSYIVDSAEDKNIYCKNTEMYNMASKIIPGASQTYSKSYRYHVPGHSPLFVENAKGSIIKDIDGNEFVDFCCGLGAITIGYRNQDIDNFVIETIKNHGNSFTLSSKLELELADLISSNIPSAEMVKFLKNGSDATTAAVRLARAYTQKLTVAVCGYHGFHDWYIASTSNDNGIPNSVKDMTKSFKYNNLDELNLLFESNSIAAVVLEPCQSEPPKNNFLENVRDLCTKNNSVLIFDEVVSGFRNALGGGQELYKVRPDLSAFGKGMANGYAISCLVGNRDIMNMIDNANVFISTTFGGDCIGISAALATIKFMIKNDTIKYCIDLGNTFLEHAKYIINNYKLSDYIEIYGVSPHCGFIFKDCDDITGLQVASLYQNLLYKKGIISLGVNNFCFSHTAKQIMCFKRSLEGVFSEIADAINNGFPDIPLINPVFKRNN